MCVIKILKHFQVNPNITLSYKKKNSTGFVRRWETGQIWLCQISSVNLKWSQFNKSLISAVESQLAMGVHFSLGLWQ